MKKILILVALCTLAFSQTTCPWWSRLWCTPEPAPQPEPEPTPDPTPPLTLLWGTTYGKIGMSLQCVNGALAILHGMSVFSVMYFFSVLMVSLVGFHLGAFMFSVPMVSSEIFYMYESIRGMMTYCTGIYVARYGSSTQ